MTRKKSTLGGADPLRKYLEKPGDGADASTSDADPIEISAETDVPKSSEYLKPPEHQKPPGSSKEERRKLYRFSTELHPAIQERLRNAVYWTPGATVAGMLEDALTAYLDRLEDEQRDGVPFPPRSAALRSGRPLK